MINLVNLASNLPRDPDIVFVFELQLRHVVVTVRVESGGDENHVRFEAVERRQPMVRSGGIRRQCSPAPAAQQQ